MKKIVLSALACCALLAPPLTLTGCNQATSSVQTVDTGYDVSEQKTWGGITFNVDPSWDVSDDDLGPSTYPESGLSISVFTTLDGQMEDPEAAWNSVLNASDLEISVDDEWDDDDIHYTKARYTSTGDTDFWLLFGFDKKSGHGFALDMSFDGTIQDEWTDEKQEALFDQVTEGVTYDPSESEVDYIAYYEQKREDYANGHSSTGSTTTSTSSDTFIETTLSKLGSFEAQTITGTGDDVIDVPSPGVPHLMTLTHNGSRNFAVHAVNSAGDDVDLLVNTIGGYSGTVTDYQNFNDVSMLSISADGAWSITFAPLSSMQPLANGGQNTGDNVLYIDEDSLTKLHITNSGESNFAIWAVGMSDYDLLVNEVGNYDGTVIWTEPQSFFIVNSEGTWTVDW